MHVYFAAVGKLFGISHLAYNGATAFLIQTSWGLMFLYAVYRLLTAVCLDRVQVVIAALMAFSSSYTLFSWLWPTTELGAMTCFAVMLVVLVTKSGYSSQQRSLFSLATIVAVLIRQNNATLSAAMLLSDPAIAGKRSSARNILADGLLLLAVAASRKIVWDEVCKGPLAQLVEQLTLNPVTFAGEIDRPRDQMVPPRPRKRENHRS
jgi:hypothetical protein